VYSFDDLWWEREVRRCRPKGTVEGDLEAFKYFCEKYVWIEHPKGRRLFELRDAQLLTAHDYLAHDQVLILKARQIGFTTLTMAFALWQALFVEDWSCINLSRRQEDAEHALSKAIYAYDRLPEELRCRLPQRVDKSVTKMTFTNGSHIESHPSRNNPARGRTVSLIVVDEWAFFENPEEAWASIKPTFDVGGRVIALSTANGAGTLFHQMWVGAKSGANTFHPIFFSWRAVPERDDTWYEQQKRDMLPWQLHQEYPNTPEEAFIKSGNPVFDVEALSKIECVEPERGYLTRVEGRMWKFNPSPEGPLSVWSPPRRGVTYVIGADVAEGQEHGDFSVAWVIDTLTGECVAKWRDRIDSDLFGSHVLAPLGWWYNGALIGVEVNGPGLSTNYALRDTGYPRIYMRTAYDDRTMRPTAKIGWRTQANTKPFMIEKLNKALRNGEIRLVDEETIAELKTFVRDPDLKMHGSPFDDQVIALAIAVVMMEHAHTSLPTSRLASGPTMNDVLNELKNPQGEVFRIGAHNVRTPSPAVT